MILNSPYVSGSLTVTGNIIASGSITLSGSVASASYAASASNALAAQTASFVLTAQTASFVANAQSASNAVTAQTASYANTFTVGSTLTAQTLVVQTITSSVDFVTGSTRFGSILGNTHVFSGSVTMNPNGLFVSSSGVVGIGTSTILNKLDINQSGSSANPVFGVGLKVYADAGNDASIAISQTARGTAVIGMAATGSAPADMIIGNDVAGNIIFRQNMTISNLSSGTEIFRINATGAAIFSSSVDGTIFNSTSNAFRFSGNNAISLVSLNSQNVVKINAAGYWGTQLVGANDKGILINNVGNVGIGTTSIDAGLTIETNAGSFNALALRDSKAFNTSPEAALAFRTKFNTAGQYSTNGLVVGYKNNATDGDQQGGLQFWTNAGSGVAEKMRITSTGIVGIGTTDPSTGFDGTIANVRLALRNGTPGASGGTSVLLIGGDNNHYSSITGEHSGGGQTSLAFGTSASVQNPTERMRILSNGNIEFKGSTNSLMRFWRDYSGSPSNVGLEINNASGTTTWAVNGNGGGIFTTSLGTGPVYSNAGNITSTNPSDERLKDNITDISWGLSDILKIRPVSYHWKDDKINQGVQFGFIAQEVQDVMPEAIKEFGNHVKYLGLEKDAIYATLVKAIQELKAQNDDLQSQINELKAQ
jgi:hypothetical protein